MVTTVLNVRGMSCASCVNHVEKNLHKVAGVANVAVNLATEKATVEHDVAAAPVPALVEAVREAGYEASPADDEDGIGRHHHGDHDVGGVSWVKLAVGAALALPVVVLGMAWMDPRSAWMQFALAAPVQVLLGWPFYRGAWKALKHGRADMDTLVALGTSVAFLYSAVVTFRGGHLVYFDTAVVILVLIGLGKLLELRARSSAAAAIRGLMSLRPAEAVVVREGAERVVAVSEVRRGDEVVVRPGWRVPVDGEVVEGNSAIDQALVTGESLPVEVGPESRVFAGTINQTGAFRMRATATGSRTLLEQIVRLVERAQSSKAGVQRLADRVAGVFVPVVLAIAAATLLGWGLAKDDWGFAVQSMVAVLIVACPCALGLATPTAIMVGTGIGAQRGILIKDAAAFERASSLTDVVLDKTGTLTLGKAQVTDVAPLDGFDAGAMLQLAASAEAMSEHPLGRAVVKYARGQGVEVMPATAFQSITAGGVRAMVEGRSVVVGRLTTLRDAGVEGVESLNAARDRLLSEAKTTVAVAVDGKPVGLIAFADELRPESAGVVTALHGMGLRTVLLSGDNRAAAEAVAKRVGIDEAIAEVLPVEKQAKVEALRKEGRVVAMVGDGINDAPALAAADVGIAVAAPGEGGDSGGGTDIAAEAGHVVLMGGGIVRLPEAVALSRATMRRIHAGLFWAFIYNLVLIPLAVAGLLHPMLAAAAMGLSSVSVVLNALWLRWRGVRPASTS